MRTSMGYPALLALTVLSCSQPASPDLATALRGIDQSRFLACSGPPALQLPLGGGQTHMSFVTNLQRGQLVGIASPAATPLESCSVDAVFENNRLVSSQFSGNPQMCDLVFSPCLRK